MQQRDPERLSRGEEFKCRYCDENFPSRNDLEQHEQQDHVEEVEREEPEMIWTPTR